MALVKILYIITSGSMGGAQAYTLALARHFNGAVAVGETAGPLLEAAARAGVPTYTIPHLVRRIHVLRDFWALTELIGLIRSVRPDLVHVNSSKAGFLGSIAGAWCGIPVVYTAHGFVFNEPRNIVARFGLVLLERIATIFRAMTIAVSDGDRTAALTYHTVRADRIKTVRNGIPPINFFNKTEARNRLGIPSSIFTIGTIANHYRTKGVDILIAAIGQLDTTQLLPFQCIIIGGGPERDHLEHAIKTMGLTKTIRLIPPISQAARLLKAFDVFVLPSRKEGFPFALLEAMQAALPVIATDVGGITEALEGVTAPIPPGDPAALAAELNRLAGNKELRDDIARRAEQQSQAFTAAKMLNETSILYKSLLDR